MLRRNCRRLRIADPGIGIRDGQIVILRLTFFRPILPAERFGAGRISARQQTRASICSSLPALRALRLVAGFAHKSPQRKSSSGHSGGGFGGGVPSSLEFGTYEASITFRARSCVRKPRSPFGDLCGFGGGNGSLVVLIQSCPPSSNLE